MMNTFNSTALLLVLVYILCTARPIQCTSTRSLRIPLQKKQLNPIESSSAEINLRTHKQGQFLGTIGVGSPAQMFDVLFDTGSSNTWIWSSQCQTHACARKHRFDSSKSSSFSDSDDGTGSDEVTIRYGSGSISASLGEDEFTVDNIIIHKQTFGSVFEESGLAFELCDMDGIIGLALPGMSVEKETLLDQALKQHTFNAPMFTFALYAGKFAAHSHITFGVLDESLYTGDLYTSNVYGENYWEIRALAIKVNGIEIGNCKIEPCKIAVDTGTSTISGPVQDIHSLTETLNIDSDCRNYASLPNIEFVLESKDTSVGFYTLNLTPQRYAQRNGNLCSPALMGLDVPAPRGP